MQDDDPTGRVDRGIGLKLTANQSGASFGDLLHESSMSAATYASRR